MDQSKGQQQKTIRSFKRKRKALPTAQQFLDGILAGNITILSQAITLVESAKPAHHALAQEIIHLCLPYSGKSMRIGITGVPGVGKSTFIESMGNYVLDQGKKLAVLAIDPSSQLTKGSILGDKTRMETLSVQQNAFIRPSPSAGALGGVANATRESIILCEAAGFDVIFVETVGVGQSEIAVHGMVDFFLLLMLSGAGDELQGIKRGIMEMADSIIINKADGDNVIRAKRARREYLNALHLFPATQSGWIPKVVTCSALNSTGLERVWEVLNEYLNHTQVKGYFEHKRAQQAENWMEETLKEKLGQLFFLDEQIKSTLPEFRDLVKNGKLNPYKAADELLTLFTASRKS